MQTEACITKVPEGLSFFEKYLTVWIVLCIIAGILPGPMMGIYSITKAAVIGMTKTFASECADLGIRVNALLPGFTDTKFASALIHNEALLNEGLAHIPMKRVATPDEMAGTVLYLVSDAASYTTGACINVDGGYLIA